MNHITLHSRVSRWLARQPPTSHRAAAISWIATIIDDYSAPPRIVVTGRAGMPCSQLVDDLGEGTMAKWRTAKLLDVGANTDLLVVLCPYVSAVEQAIRQLPIAVEVIELTDAWPQTVARVRAAAEAVAAGGDRDGQLRRRLAEVACTFPDLRCELEEMLWPA